MRQALWNLVRNAIQASPAGAEVVVRVGAGAERRGLDLEVRDRGPGIAAETRDQLFDAFFTTRAHGMGIGLAVVKRICDEHGFTIGAESNEGGTVFRVTIPRDHRLAPASKPSIGASSSDASRSWIDAASKPTS